MSNVLDDYKAALEETSKEKPDIDKIMFLVERSAKDGDSRAIHALGTWYFHGIYYKKNMREAIKFYSQAAKANEPNALLDLAICYEKGLGVKKNLRLAMELYLRAALHGDNESFHEVGRCYFHGIGVEKNRRLAWIWLDRAKELGISDSKESGW
jgi:uncharacterized protein